MIRMANAASAQGMEVAKEKMRDFLETGQESNVKSSKAMGMKARNNNDVSLRSSDEDGIRLRNMTKDGNENDEDNDRIDL